MLTLANRHLGTGISALDFQLKWKVLMQNSPLKRNLSANQNQKTQTKSSSLKLQLINTFPKYVFVMALGKFKETIFLMSELLVFK